MNRSICDISCDERALFAICLAVKDACEDIFAYLRVMKFLFVGDYSNIHVTLARELRRRGHDVTVASSGSGCMDTERDVDLTRGKGLFASFVYLSKLMRFTEQASGYDVVQIVNPGFFALRPGKLRYFFNQLKKNNGSIFLTVAGDDPVIMKGNCEDCMLPYSEMRIGEEKTLFAKRHPYYEQKWMSGPNGDYCRHVYENVDGAMSVLYEYDVLSRPYLGDRLTYTGIPIDTDALSPGEDFRGLAVPDGEKLRVAVAVKSDYEMFKGLDRLFKAVTNIAARHPNEVEVDRLQDMPYAQFMKSIRNAHVVVDQLYSMSPATNALESMARGQVAVTGGERCYFDFLGEQQDELPVYNPSPLNSDEEMIAGLEGLLLDRDKVRRISSLAPAFVKRHNDVGIVTDRFMQGWEKGVK